MTQPETTPSVAPGIDLMDNMELSADSIEPPLTEASSQDEPASRQLPQVKLVSNPYHPKGIHKQAPALIDDMEFIDTVALPGGTEKELQAIGQSLNLDDPGRSTPVRLWGTVLGEQNKHTPMGEAYLGHLLSPTASFVNHLSYNGNPLGNGFPRPQSTNLRGNRARDSTMAALGIGMPYTTVLPGSGLTVTFRPPGDNEIIDFNRAVSMDKISFGRATYGYTLSGHLAYSLRRAVDFALAHVTECNVRIKDPKELLDLIVGQDLPVFLAAFASTRYPLGLAFDQPCMASPGKCFHVHRETINPAYLIKTDENMLDERARAHLSRRSKDIYTPEQIKSYQQSLPCLAPCVKTLMSTNGVEVKFELRAPSIREILDETTAWVDSIINIVELSIEKGISQEEREGYYSVYARAQLLCEYIHYVEAVEISGVRYARDKQDVEELRNQLQVLAADDALREGFRAMMLAHIGDTTISIAGVEIIDCAACKKPIAAENTSLPRFANVLPLDVVSLFFSLLSAQLMKIVRRPVGRKTS